MVLLAEREGQRIGRHTISMCRVTMMKFWGGWDCIIVYTISFKVDADKVEVGIRSVNVNVPMFTVVIGLAHRRSNKIPHQKRTDPGSTQNGKATTDVD